MNQERRDFLRRIMETAWYAFRNRHVAGSNVRSFADALRNAWAYLRPRIVATAPAVHMRLRTMVQSPIRRSLTGPYQGRRAGEFDYLTSMMGR